MYLIWAHKLLKPSGLAREWGLTRIVPRRFEQIIVWGVVVQRKV
jgi:hypothetical protein